MASNTNSRLAIFAIACLALAAQNSRTHAFSSIQVNPTRPSTSSALHMSTAAPASITNTPSQLASALKKPSKTLTVGMEYTAANTITESEIGTLSMQARKLKVSTLWTNDKNAAKEFVQEQAGAQGNFPGPCPIVWNGETPQEGIELGVDAVVLSAASSTNDDLLAALAEKEMGSIWKVESTEDVESVTSCATPEETTICFLVDADTTEEDTMEAILEAIPTKSITIASMASMQDDNAELTKSRELKAQGVHGILLKEAIVGDAEDVEYCTFAVEGLTKKQSSTFNMSGLTGSTNGHFGGVSSSVAKTWRRIVYADSQ